MSRIARKMVRYFGYAVFGAIGLGLMAALVGALVALIGTYVIS
jgi:hypothetical protein